MKEIIDLSQPIFGGMKVYPGDPEVEIEQIHSIDKEGWRLRHIKMGSHTGTHVDAFSHMDREGKTLDEIPLESFFGKARVVEAADKFPKKVGLVFSSGKLELRVFDKIYAAKPPFIAVSSSCEFKVELERKLLEKGILTFTDLVNVDKLPTDKTFMFYGFPLKIKDGDGSPVRAVAIVDD